jgi:F-type H+-transporting ATPase subunit b
MIFLALAENSIQLVPDGTLLINAVLILVMVWVLDHTLFKPINRILEEREKLTKGQFGAAGDIMQKVDDGLAQYERAMFEARSEGYKMLEQERALAMRDRQETLDATRDELANLVAQEKSTIKRQAETAGASIEATAHTLATEIGSTILRRQL